ncbi:MAG TPA: hypothetical protein VK615_09425 [Candidatus Binatia bacterium]|nr:hypothetical protein [Candidatus Binatia bacterium]
MTVTGTFLDAADAPRKKVAVQFMCETNPAVDSLGVLTVGPVVKTITDDDGEISQVLDHGIYLVQVGTNVRDKFRIQVPESDATADIRDLMVILAVTSPVYVPATFVPVSGNNFQYNAGKLQLKNTDTGLYHTLWVVGAVGQEQTQLDQPGDGAIVVSGLVPIYGNNYRLKNGYLQFKNSDTGLYHTLNVAGPVGFEQLNIVTPGDA